MHYIKTPVQIYSKKGTLPNDRNLRFDRNTNQTPFTEAAARGVL